ncbi:hypothetical protein C3V43_11095 [Bacteroides heparinolyticus]|uniref:hypothetical protein n=1 Tax=Prevotella heparinolytica TaxID=28113 RepID=UPI000D02DE74|nr:hypothetical protein [Bacteroides heparinolyticus]AVM58236.1 hypothetical protein C3V43_11095 [Bacteroides heparinolyticus]
MHQLLHANPFLDGAAGRALYIQAFTERFSFGNVRISQIQTVRQRQSNVNAPWDVLYIAQTVFIINDDSRQSGVNYINKHRRGAFDVARFDEQGNARAFTLWNGQQDWLHVFMYKSKIERQP